MDKYLVTYADQNGNTETIRAESLEALSRELAELGYDGATVRAYDEAGFTRGWVSATTWRYE